MTMARAKRKAITARTKTTSSAPKKRPLRTIAQRPVLGDVPMKAPGCPWRFWSGVIGLSTTLCAFDRESPVGNASDLSQRGRAALADYMIGLWSRFRDDK
jgi:hypothetical protein